MRFVKMHGLGNDYVLVHTVTDPVTEPSTLARSISDRHRGVGSDGLILVTPSEIADLGMKIYNADGSRAQMCGNGIRCVAKYAVERGLCSSATLRIETDAGVRKATCAVTDGSVTHVQIDMGSPRFLDHSGQPPAEEDAAVIERPVPVNGRTLAVTFVSIGNPHAVVFVDTLDQVDLARDGAALASNPLLPGGINAHFVKIESPDDCTMVSWERGSGATQACGTGACAAAAAGHRLQRLQFPLTVHLPGGDLYVEQTHSEKPVNRGNLLMTGPAEEVFAGVWPCSGRVSGRSERPPVSGPANENERGAAGGGLP